MAMKHRKLFPTLTATNETEDCSNYGCYYYPAFMSPLPQPLPPPPPPSAVDQLEQNQAISPYIIIVVCLIASFFLLVSYYAIIVKYCSGSNRRSRHRSPPSQSDDTDDEFLDENRGPGPGPGPAIDHHIWFITTVGLQQSIINSITVCKYKKGEGLIEGTECSVCLSEFQEDQTLRLLPKCNHAFHIHCIDTWLRSHTNCPLCRASIVLNTLSSSMASIDQNSYNSSPIEETQVENSESDAELDGDNQVRDGGVCENRVATEGEGEILVVDDEKKDVENSIESLNSTEHGGLLRVIGDSVDKYRFMEDETQPVRRSVSLNSSSAATICPGLPNFRPAESEGNSVNQIVEVQKSDSDIVPKRDGGNLRLFRLMGSSSIEQSLHKSPVSMKRSFSCGGNFFLSRHNRSLNSILP